MTNNASLRIGIDTGGTFTDIVCVDDTSGAMRVTKVSSTPSNPAVALVRGVHAILNEWGAGVDDLAVLSAVQRPISVKCIQEPAPAPAWKTKPTWYLLAEEDRMISPKTQRFMAERVKATVRSFPVDHTPLLTAPEKVVEVILEAAEATLA